MFIHWPTGFLEQNGLRQGSQAPSPLGLTDKQLVVHYTATGGRKRFGERVFAKMVLDTWSRLFDFRLEWSPRCSPEEANSFPPTFNPA